MDRELKEIRRQLPAYIANAKEGDSNACFNILLYIRKVVNLGEPLESEVSDYLDLALGKLSNSEKNRLIVAMGKASRNLDTPEVIASIPSLSFAATRRLSKKLTSKLGRPEKSDEQDVREIKIGARIAARTNQLKEEGQDSAPLNAMQDIQETLESEGVKIRQRSLQKALALYNTYRKWGFIDENGDFILLDSHSKKIPPKGN